MIRLWLPVGRRVLLLIAFLVFLLTLLPMRLALNALGLDDGVSARDVSGSVWDGRIDRLTVAGVDLGDVTASLSPWSLLIGRARLDLTRNGGGDPLRGAISVSRNAVGVDEFDASVPIGAALAPLPIGSVETSKLSVRFVGGACIRASGGARVRLSGSLAGVTLAEGLAGVAVCDGKYVRLPLASQSGQERLDFRLAADGSYVADLIAVEPAADRVAGLTALGFTAVPGGYRLRVTGVVG